jgi:hypothetical protein
MASARLSIATLMSVAAAFMLLVTLPMSTLAKSYVVGDGAGWSVPSSPMFYAEWVNKHSPFHIGDTLGKLLAKHDCCRTYTTVAWYPSNSFYCVCMRIFHELRQIGFCSNMIMNQEHATKLIWLRNFADRLMSIVAVVVIGFFFLAV